jgi:hypothetical protein
MSADEPKERPLKDVKTMRSKGVSLMELASVGLAFVLLGVVLSIGAYINSSVNTAGGFVAGSASATAVGNATVGISTVASWLPIIAVVIAAGAVIGILVASFKFGGV